MTPARLALVFALTVAGPPAGATSPPSAPSTPTDPAASPAPERSSPRIIELCAVFSPALDDFVVLPGLRVGRLGDDEAFTLPDDAPPDAEFVQCARASLLPAPSDWKVVAAGMPLVIDSDGRMVAIEIAAAHVQVRALKGEFTADEMPAIQAWLDRAQGLIETAQAASDDA